MIKFPLQQLIKFIDIVLGMLEDLVVQLEKLDPAVPARLPLVLSQSVSQSVSQSGLELQGQLKIGTGDLVNECNMFCVGHARCLSWWV